MVLDELAEIVTKYRNSSDILIGGDVNASIHRSKLNSRDNDFQKFLMELNLKIPISFPFQPISHIHSSQLCSILLGVYVFFHHNSDSYRVFY
jgi:hypothetical protein